MTLPIAPIEVKDGLNSQALEAYLSTYIPSFAGPLTIRQFPGGQSNPTYSLSTPRHRYVLRRKPVGTLLSSAHAVDREYRVIEALGSRTEVPVARARVLCLDEQVVGTPFYVMDFVEGRIFWDAALPDIAREDRPRYFEAMVTALARLHTVDYAAVGLGDFGKPGNYFSRQIARWSKQYREDKEAGRVDAMERLIEWLPGHIPAAGEICLIHGDYRVDNVIFHPTEPKIMAILDWELSTLGHPLADFGYHLMMYRMPSMAVTGLGGRDLRMLNLPSEDEYVAAYCRHTGREGIENLDFYLAFNFFRLAAIFHGIRGRLQRGTAHSAHAKKYADSVEAVAELGWTQARRA
jgi:aminoglycoside phosphotransferase (APT) family kinase protein